MRAVIQRVSHASVSINGNIYNSIGKGLLVLAAIEELDTEEDIVWLSNKISNLRIFNDENQVMNLSVKDIGGELLIISQFTLFAQTKKGNRPSYLRAATPDTAIPLYEKFLRQLGKTGIPVKKGIFGADMKVTLLNDGPVTIVIDTKNKE
jgi:D-tyrosyl-tRNA(Tyr) deacylase